MSGNQIRRRATDEELRELERQLAELPDNGKHLREALKNGILLGIFFSALAALVWAGIAWISRIVFHIEFGWRSPVAIYCLGAIILAGVIVAAIATRQWMSGFKDYRPLMSADIDAAEVIDEQHEFVAAKWYVEQEHGGVIWCLRTPDDRVYVWYDFDIVRLVEEAKEASKAEPEYSFRALSQLRTVKGALSNAIISEAFSGAELPVESTDDLLIEDSRDWPEDREYFAMPWDRLDEWAADEAQRA